MHEAAAGARASRGGSRIELIDLAGTAPYTDEDLVGIARGSPPPPPSPSSPAVRAAASAVARAQLRSAPDERQRFDVRKTTCKSERDKEKLLANGDRWERLIARNLELDAPYR
jgi:hypothetical protein